ncbi:MAG TPA: AI-2E family transporter [Usitatibacter sp.]|nr:AI-2E family transporter [Usitatibacter sp.]
MPADKRGIDERFFHALLVVVSIAFAWILWPFFAAILWAVVLAILFTRVNDRLTAQFGGRPNLAALTTLVIVLVLVIMPLMLVGSMLVQEAAGVYQRVKSGEIDFGRYARQIFEALPAWTTPLLERFGLTDFAALQERAAQGLGKGTQVVAGQVLVVGQGTLEFVVSFFVMLYILFFLLRDGHALMRRIRRAVPLSQDRQGALLDKFIVVVRATVKGNVVVAILQGALGGLIFWILGIDGVVLWSVVMAILSLLPAVGTALVWGPVAIYFLATGAVVKGVVLMLYGILVIGLVDNVVRPMLVGKDTRMPDYLVLVATLGGIAIFGINGFIIGPVIAALFLASWDLFSDRNDRGQTT